MVTFEKMNHAAFQEYMAFMLPDYARDTAEHYLLTIDQANEKAKKQMESLLPDDENSDGHYLFEKKKKRKLRVISGSM
ncbi:hypothetical protein [Bacillus sp. NEB1478]|uniref:hypothetical protein n=1 Tax=Bacillus sp. NEB1478 TaxID=3073816 RepID=UPI002872FAF1|nr:hypothetical protein [Bacillus sp. NEB1478]WNB91219.1 hypothetical protein RGB74_15090 [Bacillus sp. NEB1478]